MEPSTFMITLLQAMQRVERPESNWSAVAVFEERAESHAVVEMEVLVVFILSRGYQLTQLSYTVAVVYLV